MEHVVHVRRCAAEYRKLRLIERETRVRCCAFARAHDARIRVRELAWRRRIDCRGRGRARKIRLALLRDLRCLLVRVCDAEEPRIVEWFRDELNRERQT